MNLIDESNSGAKSSKKIFALGGIAVVILVIIIIVLLSYSSILNKNKLSLTVNLKKYSTSYLLPKDDVIYIGIEDLTKMLGDGYTYVSGSRTSESDNQCYVTNGNESTFFVVGSNSFYKVLEADNQRAYYDLEKPIIKENGKFYMPISATKTAFNTSFEKNNNSYVITSIGTIEGAYNQEESKTFFPDPSIVWDTSYRNKILLKNGLVIVKGPRDELGVAKLSQTTDKKKKTVTVSTENVIDPKYKSITYVEKYSYLIVEADGKKGIVKLVEEDGNFKVNTVINPQYDDIFPITDKLFLITRIEISEASNKKEEVKKYGIVKSSDRQEDDIVLPTEYDQIGVKMSDFPDNDLTNAYILYDNMIPVKKNNLWGFTNLKGSVIISLQYDDLGYSENKNPNSNVLIIPEEEAIVVKKNGYYGMISKTNRTLIKNTLSKVYRDVVDGKTTYTMVYGEHGEQSRDVLKYFNDVVNKKNNSNDGSTNSSSDNNDKKEEDSSNENNTDSNTNKNTNENDTKSAENENKDSSKEEDE